MPSNASLTAATASKTGRSWVSASSSARRFSSGSCAAVMRAIVPLAAAESLQRRDCLDLHLRSRGERRDLDRGPRRGLIADVTGVDLVHSLEVAEVDEVDCRLHELVEARARLLQNGAQIGEHLLGLVLDRLDDDLCVLRPQGELARDEHEPTGLDRLRVRRPLKGRGCVLGANNFLHVLRAPFFGALRCSQARPSAEPSALKIASSTCCSSSPSTSLTWRFNPASATNTSRNPATRSLPSPATCTPDRSKFE